MKAWKRCLAALLSFTILYTSTGSAQAAGTFSEKFLTWNATRAEILSEYYGVSEKETAVLMNDAVNQGYEYLISYPYPNEEKSKKNLVAVDYLNKNVYAKSYTSGGYTWKPVTAVITADGTEQETIALTEGICYFDGKEYNASAAFTYSGNSYTADVIYELWVDIETAEQSRIMNIPAVLAQTASNLAIDLKGMRLNIKNLGVMSPYLNQLLTLEFEVEEIKLVETENEEGELVKVEERALTTEPALDPTEDAEVIAAISAIYNEYSQSNALILYTLAEEYSADVNRVLSFAFEKGAQVRDKSAEFFEYVNTLKSSMKLKKVINKLSTENVELYNELRYLSSTTTALVGTARKPGPLRELKNADNWKILDETVKASIFASGYRQEDFSALEQSAYALRSATVNVPSITTENILAAQTTVSCNITIYDVNITVSGKVVSDGVGNKELIDLQSASTTLKLLAGTSADEVNEAVLKCGIEENTLTAWNGLSSEYSINAANYERKATNVTKDLKQNLEYAISYEPKYFSVKTNFAGNEKLPFGYVMELPSAGDDSDISYEYNIESEGGTKLNLEEGATYKITKAVSITQVEGAVKEEHRLYDYLLKDEQYKFEPGVQQIFQSPALNSPTIKIYTPDGSTVSEIVFEDGEYRITAKTVNAGSGMKWIPYVAKVVLSDQTVEVPFDDNGVAAWTNPDFTRVDVVYQLKIDKIKDGWTTEDYTNEDVKEALNLPARLVDEVATQNQLLSGDSGVTIKRLYEKMNTEDMKLVMSQEILGSLGEAMTTPAGRNAISQMQASEKETVKKPADPKFNNGAWDFANEQLALYTYMQHCADGGWSLANYYKNGYYNDIRKHASIVGNCLIAVSADPGFATFLSNVGLGNADSYKTKISGLGNELVSLADKLNPPPAELNMETPEFPTLIADLIALKGQVSAIEESNDLYTYTQFSKYSEKILCVQVKVGVGSASAESVLEYPKDGTTYTLTEENVQEIKSEIANLEIECGLTEENKQYYDEQGGTDIPAAGTVLNKNISIVRCYSPKEFKVTCEGLEKYKETFLYNDDNVYVLQLPAYSEDINEVNYYGYHIPGEEEIIKVYNGSEKNYALKGEALEKLLKEGSLRISVSMYQSITEWDIQPDVKLAEAKAKKIIVDYKFDHEKGLLFIDASPEGLKKADFNRYVTFYTEASGTAETIFHNTHCEGADHPMLGNGTIVECHSPDKKGEMKKTEITLILMGDVNKDSLVDEKDMQLLKKNYFESTSQNKPIGDSAAKYAANMNNNRDCGDSNDALYIVMKYLYWKNTSGKTYHSVL